MHLGSLYAALASFLHARAQQGKWLLRIDDVDTLRNVSGATESIINTLQLFGLHWDDQVQYQTESQAIYQGIITNLKDQALVYPCVCTRKALSANNTSVYPGICLNANIKKDSPHSLRIRSKNSEILFNDELQGGYRHNLSTQYGDFIVKRKDNIMAYQLTVVIDDFLQKVSHVVRGFDLLDSTPKQIYLQQMLGYPTPKYCHVPIIVDQKGDKLSKQTFAQAVSNKNPEKTLFFLLELLKQNPPVQLKNATIDELISWGIENWQVDNLRNIHEIING